MSRLARTSRTVETLITRVKDAFGADEVLLNVELLDGLQNAELNGAPPRVVFIVGNTQLVMANLCAVKDAFATLVETIECRIWGLEAEGDFDQNARIPAIELAKDIAAVAHAEYGANVSGGTIEPARETHVTKYGEYLVLTLSVKCPVYRVDNSVAVQTGGGTNGV